MNQVYPAFLAHQNTSECNCDTVCNCYAGIPESGPALLSLFEKARLHFHRQILLGTWSRKDKTWMRGRIRLLESLINLECAKEAVRSELIAAR